MRLVVSCGWLFLALMIGTYGVANLLQSAAAARTTAHYGFHPGLLLRLAGQRTYLYGIGCQIVGFVFSVLARRDLPLFLVQASVAAGLGVTAVLGVVLLRWSLPAAEIALLVLLFGGITALVLAAKPAHSRELSLTMIILLAAAAVVLLVAGYFAARLTGVLGSVVLGSLAGISYSAAAIAARPLAVEHTAFGFLGNPLIYLLIVHSLVGQLLLASALQRGSTTAAVAAMDAAGAVPAAIVGVLLLGDRIHPGRHWLAVVGFLVTLVAVIGLTRYAQPQQHHGTGRTGRTSKARVAAAPTR